MVTWTFLLTSFIVVATPGTGALFTLATGLSRGPRAATLAACACTLGTLPHLVAALTGLAALLHASGVAFAVVKYAGVTYLLWMAWSTWRDTGSLPVPCAETEPPRSRRRRMLVQGITLNILNPKLTIFFVAFLPQFVPSGTPGAMPKMLLLGGIFMTMTFVVFTGYGVGAAAVRDRVLARPAVVSWMRRTFAVTFVALGARLGFESG